MQVEVVYCPSPHVVDRRVLQLADGATVALALEASGVLARHGLEAAAVRVGIWGRVAQPQSALREADRVEVYRPLQVDPKEARRQRYKRSRPARPA